MHVPFFLSFFFLSALKFMLGRSNGPGPVLQKPGSYTNHINQSYKIIKLETNYIICTPFKQDELLDDPLACSCHRNFHRKEIEGECHNHHLKERKFVGHKGVLISGAEAFGCNYNNPASHGHIPSPLPHQTVMPLGALQASEADQMEGVGGARAPHMVKKRFRTKFTPEQKEKMLNFADRIGWRLQRQEESMVQQFCQEIGVKRRVLKVWMHNNKHSLAKKELPPA